MKCLCAVALLCLALAGSAHADTFTQFTFTGVCSDCSGTATATLTVTGFIPGQAFTLDLSNFVSFHYNGTNLRPPFDITPSDNPDVDGSLGPTFPNPYHVHVATPDTVRAFASEADGSWGVSSGQGLDDQGTSSNWDLAAPEPVTAAIAAIGLLALALISRYSRSLLQAI